MKWSASGARLGFIAAMVWLGGCGGGGSHRSDGSASAPRRGLPLASMSNARGVVRVGATAADQAEILLIDAQTQRPIDGALAQAVPQEGGGYLVRLSKDTAFLQPEVVSCGRGEKLTVPMIPATPDVPGRLVRVNQVVYDNELVGEVGLAEIPALAEKEDRPEIIFQPLLDEAAMQPGVKFAVYRAALPRTLMAIRIDGPPPRDGHIVRGNARAVSTSGVRRSGRRAEPQLVGAVAQGRAGEERPAPAVTDVAVAAPDASGDTVVKWTVEDPAARLVAIDVGIDTTDPDRRLGLEERALPVRVSRGEHFACVRLVFGGSDLEPRVRCLLFDAPMAPPAGNVRVTMRAMDMAAPKVGHPVAVEVEVENVGQADVADFPVDVVLSRDGRLEGGLGQARRLLVDRIKPGRKAVRRAEVVPPRDGPLYIVARADGQRRLGEGNPEDNQERRPLVVMPEGSNHAPVVSVATTATAAGGGKLLRGQALKLRASASDAEDGDLSSRISWWSSRDGKLGEGPTLETTALTPGLHRVSAQVQDMGMPAARARGGRRPADEGRLASARELQAAELPQLVVAEVEIEVVDDRAAIDSPPMASAGPDLTATCCGELVPLASARDADPGDRLTFAWTATGPAGAVAVGAADQLAPRFVPPGPGLYRLALAVSDGKVSARDEVLVNVLPASANKVPQLTLLVPPTALPGAMVRAAVMATDGDMDGLAVSYALAAPAGSGAALVDGETFMPGFVPDLEGTYLLTARADDGRGGVATASASTAVMAAADVDGGAAVRDALPSESAARAPDVLPDDATPSPPPPPPLDADLPASPDAGAPPDDAAAPAVDAAQVPPDLDPGAPDAAAPPPDVALPPDAPPPVDMMAAPPPDAALPPDAAPPTDMDPPEAPLPPDMDPPPDAEPPDVPVDAAGPCDPVQQTGCAGGDTCYVDQSNNHQCLLPGSAGEDQPCLAPNDCMTGLGCFNGPGGQLCRPYCDTRAPSCPIDKNMCAVISGGPFGFCQSTAPPDSGGGGCDPVAQIGCSAGQACYADPGTSACLTEGVNGEDAVCSVHSDCARGYGCFDGPGGRLCRAYCYTTAQPNGCSTSNPMCAPLDTGPVGTCLPPPPQDGGAPDVPVDSAMTFDDAAAMAM
jgi:hypothetical protein